MSLVQRERPPATDPDGALVLLHGRGVDENDLFPLLGSLDPQRRLLGLTPRAPLQLPPAGNHWYAIRQIGHPDPETFLATLPRLAGWLDEALAGHGLDIGRTVIGGFSQGAVMSYALALGPERPAPAGLLAMSGFMPTVEGFELDPARARDFPVAVAHGTHDPIIGVEWGRDARDRLEAAGVQPLYREYPVLHTIHPSFIEEARAWLDALPPARPEWAAG